MYRRTGGVTNSAELRSPTEYPPDWDLLNLIDLDFTSSFSTPCLKEQSILAPVKMKPAKTAPTISAIGSSLWMEEGIKPVKAVLDTLQGFDLPEGISLESLIADGGLNTPPPLPDLSDYITEVGKVSGSGRFLPDFVKKEGERKRFAAFSESSDDSALLDPSIENTVNLTQHFTLQNFVSTDSELLGDLNSDPLYLEEDEKQLTVENQQQNQQLFIFDNERSTAVSPSQRYGEQSIDRSVFYLPSVCQEEEEPIEEEEVGQVEQQSINNFDGQCGVVGGAEIITISIEEFERLTGDLNLLPETSLVLSDPVSTNQLRAPPIQPVNQPKSSQSTAAITPKQTDRRDIEKTPPSGRHERKSSSVSGGSSRKRRIASLDKESEEYRDKRARNNESVRKSRDKARQKQEETEDRMQILSNENRRLQDRVDSLEKELSVLRGLFSSTSTSLPPAPSV